MSRYEELGHYLDAVGILACNANPDLPALDDLGFCWRDMTELLDRHGLFYSKAYRKRTVYLSPQVYSLLKQCRVPKEMGPDAVALYGLLQNNPPMEAAELKRLSLMDGKRYAKAFDFLLEHLYVTAIWNGRYLNESWSTFLYGTAEAWEALAPPQTPCADAAGRLRAILGRTLPEAGVAKLLGEA